jgi:hypothetical protein
MPTKYRLPLLYRLRQRGIAAQVAWRRFRQPHSPTYYLAAHGDDGNAGTMCSPFRTMAGAIAGTPNGSTIRMMSSPK